MSLSLTTFGFQTSMAPAASRLGPIGRLRLMLRAAQTRRQLAELEDHMLSDIGVSRVDALRESRRAPWDVAPPA